MDTQTDELFRRDMSTQAFAPVTNITDGSAPVRAPVRAPDRTMIDDPPIDYTDYDEAGRSFLEVLEEEAGEKLDMSKTKISGMRDPNRLSVNVETLNADGSSSIISVPKPTALLQQQQQQKRRMTEVERLTKDILLPDDESPSKKKRAQVTIYQAGTTSAIPSLTAKNPDDPSTWRSYERLTGTKNTSAIASTSTRKSITKK